MPDSNDEGFYERFEETEGSGIVFGGSPSPGLILDPASKDNLPLMSRELFVPQAMSAKDLTAQLSNLPSASTLQVDRSKLDQLDRNIQDILRQQQNMHLRAYLEEAQRFIESGQFRKALDRLEKALGLDATSVPTLFLKGYCFFSLQEYEQASNTLHQARAHAGPQDASVLLLILLLEAVCADALLQAIQKKVKELLDNEQPVQALAVVENELTRHPADPVLLHDRCGILIVLKRFSDARKGINDAIARVGPGNVAHFQELLTILREQEASQLMEAVRAALRRGDLTTANRELTNGRAVLAGQEYYTAVCEYVQERLYPREEARAGGWFGRGKGRQKKSLQRVLMWLLADELAEGMLALEKQQFADAWRAFEVAYKIDGRCELIAYLTRLAAYREFERMMELNKKAEDLDLEAAQRLLNLAARKIPLELTDPALAKSVRNLRQAAQFNQAEVSVALCMQNFKTMIDAYQQNHINPYDYSARSKARRQIAEQLLAVAEAQRQQTRGSRHTRLLNMLEKRLKALEKQLE